MDKIFLPLGLVVLFVVLYFFGLDYFWVAILAPLGFFLFGFQVLKP